MKKETIIARDKEQLRYLVKTCIDREGDSCDLNHIDTSLITDMSGLFMNESFTGDISGWNVSAVRSMESMFAN